MNLKPILLWLKIVGFISSVCFPCQAQIFDQSNSKNRVKTNMTSYLTYHANLCYERVLSKNFTVSTQVRYRPMLKTNRLITNIVGLFYPSVNLSSNDSKYNSFSFTPEIRYYYKESFRGFYVAPYTRIRKVNYELEMTMLNAQRIELLGPVQGNTSSIMFGLMLGINVPINEKMSFDVSFGGFHFSRHKVEQRWTSPIALTERDQQIMESGNIIVPSNYNRTERYSETTEREIFNRNRFNNIGVRAMGLSFCYRF